MERRHRIFPEEVIPVMTAIHSTLSTMNYSDPETFFLFRVLWRFKEHRTGPPCYPDIDKNAINELLREVEAILLRYL